MENWYNSIISFFKSYCSTVHFRRIISIYQPTNAHIISHKTILKHFKTLPHLSILSDHHQEALFLAKVAQLRDSCSMSDDLPVLCDVRLRPSYSARGVTSSNAESTWDTSLVSAEHCVIRMFWDVAMCRWLCGYRRFERPLKRR